MIPMARNLSPEEAQAILEELQSRCPVRAFINNLATVTQKEILQRSSTYTLVTSSNQGGKTTTAVVDCAAVLRGIHPFKPWCGPVKVLIVVPSRVQAAGIWGQRLTVKSEIRHTIMSKANVEVNLAEVPLIPQGEIADIRMTHAPQGDYPGFIKLKNGSEARIALSGDPNGWQRLQGMPFDMIYRDEAVGNQDLSDELLPRLVVAQTSVQQGKRPWGGEMLWVATSTLVNDEFEAYKERCENGAPGHGIHWINPNENPAVSMEVRTAMLGNMSEDAGKIRMLGTADAIDDVLIFRNQLDAKRHRLVDVYEPSPQDNIWIGWDPGWDHPYGLVFAAISPNNPQQLIVWKTVIERKKTIDHTANIIASTLDGRMAEAFVFDPASKKTEHSRGESLAYQMEKLFEQMGIKSHRGILYGRNRYEDTLPAMQRYLDPTPDDKKADPLIKIAGDSPENPTGCDRAWEQLLKYRRKPNVRSDRGYNIHRKDDELVDVIRYIISRVPFWCRREPNIARHTSLSHASVILAPEPTAPDKLLITPDMSKDMQIHIARLRESSRLIEDRFSDGVQRLGTGRLGF